MTSRATLTVLRTKVCRWTVPKIVKCCCWFVLTEGMGIREEQRERERRRESAGSSEGMRGEDDA